MNEWVHGWWKEATQWHVPAPIHTLYAFRNSRRFLMVYRDPYAHTLAGRAASEIQIEVYRWWQVGGSHSPTLYRNAYKILNCFIAVLPHARRERSCSSTELHQRAQRYSCCPCNGCHASASGREHAASSTWPWVFVPAGCWRGEPAGERPAKLQEGCWGRASVRGQVGRGRSGGSSLGGGVRMVACHRILSPLWDVEPDKCLLGSAPAGVDLSRLAGAARVLHRIMDPMSLCP